MTGTVTKPLCKIDLLQFGREAKDKLPSHYTDGWIPIEDFPTIDRPQKQNREAVGTDESPFDGVWYFDGLWSFPTTYSNSKTMKAKPCFFKFKFTQVGDEDITVSQVGSKESVTGKINEGTVTFDLGLITFEGSISEDEMSIHFALRTDDKIAELDLPSNYPDVVAYKDSPDFYVYSFQLCVQSTRRDVLRAARESLRKRSFKIIRKAMTGKMPIESSGCYAPLYNTGPMCDHCFDSATTQFFFKQDAIIPDRWSRRISR